MSAVRCISMCMLLISSCSVVNGFQKCVVQLNCNVYLLAGDFISSGLQTRDEHFKLK